MKTGNVAEFNRWAEKNWLPTDRWFDVDFHVTKNKTLICWPMIHENLIEDSKFSSVIRKPKLFCCQRGKKN